MRGLQKWAAFAVLAVLGFSTVASATPYWIAWEGNDLPENQGWLRNAGGVGEVRTLHDGLLTLDGMASTSIHDIAYQYRPGSLDPDPGEQFVIEWRVRVEAVGSYPYDSIVSFSSDDSWAVDIDLSVNNVRVLPGWTVIPLEEGLFHDFRVVSQDLQWFSLYVDGDLAYAGTSDQTIGPAYVAWGDGAIGASSRCTWDYFRYGVVALPEPGCGVALLAAGAVARRRRIR